MSAKPAAAIEHLPQRSLLRLLAVMLLVTAPHLLRLPAWESALVLAIGVWRGSAALRHWPMPHALIKVALTLAVFAGVFATYGRVWGQNAGVALLVVMLALKLVELRERRDVMVTVFLLYFLLVTHFLYSQALWTSAYLLLSTIAITAVLIDVHHEGAARPGKMVLRLAGVLVLQSLPLMLLMFVLFPRLPGPLWTLPDDAGAAHSGLSDSMSPGDISRLALSEDIAFRVRFLDAVPADAERYWRGPLLSDYDGLRWRASSRNARAPVPDVELSGASYRYEITLEPTRQPWLFALDLPDAQRLPARSRLTSDYQLVATEPVRELRRYALQSRPRYRLQMQLPPVLRAATLALPPQASPRARALVQRWRHSAGDNDMEVVRAALRLFGQAPFAYTLEPGALGANGGDRVDEFLFETRRGYCEHYAGAFTLLMRAAGIPARVVTGYLGGQPNPFGDWYVLRQSDAHAWSEVWIADQGWVRVDPTAAVSPERVDRSLSAARSRRGSGSALATLDWSSLRYRLESGWDWIDARWNGLVLGYGTDSQRELLSRIGLGDWQSMLLALTGGVTLLLSVLGLALMRRAAPAAPGPALRLWRHALRPLQRLGLQQRPDEGARDFVDRVLLRRPDLRAPLQRLLSAYLRLRYEAAATPEAMRELKAAADALRI